MMGSVSEANLDLIYVSYTQYEASETDQGFEQHSACMPL